MSPRVLPTLVLLLAADFLFHGAPVAQAAEEVDPTATTSQPASSVPAADNREADKQKRAMAGLLALCGILIGGLMFVVLVMVWGARLRRLARRELPAQTTLQNELWFLKPPKSPPE